MGEQPPGTREAGPRSPALPLAPSERQSAESNSVAQPTPQRLVPHVVAWSRFGPPAPRRLHEAPQCRLSVEERAELGRLFDAACARAEQVRAKHVDRLDRLAFECGQKVARGEMLLADATERLERVAFAVAPLARVAADRDDPAVAFVGRYVIPPDLATRVVAESYAAGARAAVAS